MKGKFAKLYDNIKEKYDKIKASIYNTRKTCHLGNCLSLKENEEPRKQKQNCRDYTVKEIFLSFEKILWYGD